MQTERSEAVVDEARVPGTGALVEANGRQRQAGSAEVLIQRSISRLASLPVSCNMRMFN